MPSLRGSTLGRGRPHQHHRPIPHFNQLDRTPRGRPAARRSAPQPTTCAWAGPALWSGPTTLVSSLVLAEVGCAPTIRNPSAVGAGTLGAGPGIRSHGRRLAPHRPPERAAAHNEGQLHLAGGEQLKVPALGAAERLYLPPRPAHPLGTPENPSLQRALDPARVAARVLSGVLDESIHQTDSAAMGTRVVIHPVSVGVSDAPPGPGLTEGQEPHTRTASGSLPNPHDPLRAPQVGISGPRHGQ